MNAYRQLLHFCERYDLKNRHVVVAVSGGLDSMVLLDLCRQARLDREIFSGLSVVHVHHGLRTNAQTDADFVASYCAANGIACEIAHVQVDINAGIGVEASARRARYEAIRTATRRYENAVCFVAHHQRDQVETFLLRWLRGASLTGLGSIRNHVKFCGVDIYRPLLETPHGIIQRYAENRGITHVEDESNFDLTLTRNYLRQQVLPLLVKLQPDLEIRTSSMVQLLQSDDDYLQQAAWTRLDEVVEEKTENRFELDIDRLTSLHLSLQRRIIHILLNCLSDGEWSARHVAAVLHLVSQTASPSASANLAHGISAVRSYRRLYIGFCPSGNAAAGRHCWRWHLSRQSRLDVTQNAIHWKFRARPLQGPTDRVWTSSLWHLWLPDVSELDVATGMPTNVRVRPLGLHGTKKLQDLFSDRKIPRALRSQWPVFSIQDEVIWIPGVVRCEPYRVTETQASRWVVVSHPSSDLLRNMDM